MIWIILYILIAAVATFGLLIGSAYDPKCDFPWPVVCGIFWPLAGPIAAAFIAAKWYLNSKN